MQDAARQPLGLLAARLEVLSSSSAMNAMIYIRSNKAEYSTTA